MISYIFSYAFEGLFESTILDYFLSKKSHKFNY